MQSLPPHPDPLFGRERELAEVTSTLKQHGVCSIGGLPGIGKSRLAWAAGEQHAGPTVWIDAQAQPAESLEQLIETALGENQPVRSELGTLVVLDDVAKPEQLRDWALNLYQSRSLKVLFTARWDLADVVLGQIDRESALSCFMHHARRIDPTIGLDASDREIIADVAAAFGGWPLALRLASQQLAVATPAELRDRLPDDETGPGTLQNVIALTWDSWSAEQQHQVARLAVFEGFIETNAAAAVLERSDRDASEALKRLTQAGIARRRVVRGESGVVLSPPFREFARASTESDVRDRAHNLLAQYLVAITSPLLQRDSVSLRTVVLQYGPDFARTITRELETRPNLCVDLAFTLVMGSSEYGSPWIEAVIDDVRRLNDQDLSPKSAARRDWVIGCHARTGGGVDDAAEAWERAAKSAEELVQIRALIALAELKIWTDNEQVEPLLSRLPDSLNARRRATVQHVRGVSAFVRGDREATRKHLLEAMLQFDALGDATGRARANWYLAVMEHQLFDFEAARHRYRSALVDAESIAGNANVFRFGMGLAELEADQGNLETALAQAERLRRRASNDAWAAQRLDLFEASVLLLARRTNEAEARVSGDRNGDIPLSPHRAWKRLLEGYIAVAHHDLDLAKVAFDDVPELAVRAYEQPLRRFAAVSADLIDMSRGVAADRAASFEWEGEPLYRELRRLLESGEAIRRALDEGRVDAARSLARAHDEGGHPQARGTIDVRLIRRVLVESFGPGMGGWPSRPQAELVIGPAGNWFECGGRRVDLETRRALPRLLEALAETADDPVSSLDVWTLVEIGWPGESIEPESAASRVYTSIARLRRLGLRDFLVTRGEGYALSGSIERR